MKKFILTMLMGMMVLGAMAQGGKLLVRSTFENFGDSVYLKAQSSVFKGKTYAVTGEMMEVKLDLTDADHITIGRWFNGRGQAEEGDITLPAIPGETLVISKDESGNICLSGSQFYVDYNEARNVVEPINRAGQEYVDGLKARMASGVPREQLMAEAQERVPQLMQDIADAVIEYVKAHPDQDAAAALINEIPEDVENYEAAAALLTDRARGSVAANLYKKNLKKAKKEAAEHAKRYALEGQMAPDFTLMDINGKPLTLSSLRGKWVIIDFWGSWCGWCIKGMPKMKEYYAKYHGKLEILGVDCNDTVEKWKAAVAKHELPWLHVYWDMDDENCPNVPDLYNVKGFPTKLVVDPEGKVAKIIIGEDPAFYDYLDEVLKQ